MRSNAKLTKTVGRRVRKFRRDIGMTQEELASKARISSTYIGYIEQGRNLPSLDVLRRIAKHLQVNFSELMD